MTTKEALAKHGISRESWDLFLRIASDNVRPPGRKPGERRRVKDLFPELSHGWSYVSGMRDSLWAWVNADQEAYVALNTAMCRAVEKASRAGNPK